MQKWKQQAYPFHVLLTQSVHATEVCRSFIYVCVYMQMFLYIFMNIKLNFTGRIAPSLEIPFLLQYLHVYVFRESFLCMYTLSKIIVLNAIVLVDMNTTAAAKSLACSFWIWWDKFLTTIMQTNINSVLNIFACKDTLPVCSYIGKLPEV